MADPFKIIDQLIDREERIGDFIANGPSGGLPGYVRDQYRHRCRELANLPAWARALGGLPTASAGRICTPYWDANDWDGPVNPGPIATGGQCAGILYRINWSWSAGAFNSGPQTADRTGPLSFDSTGTGSLDCGSSGAIYNVLTLREGTGASPVGLFAGCGATLNNLAIIRLDGLPDNCGDPPDQPLTRGPNPPPNPGPLPGPEPTPNPRNPTGPPLFPIPPFDDPNFGPIPIDEPEDDAGGAGPPAGGDGLPGDPEAVGPDAGDAEGGEPGADIDFGDPPEGRVWVGAVVEADVDTRYGNIPDTGPGNTVYPTTVGNASLIYEGYRGSNTRILSKFTDLYRQVSSVVLRGCRLSSLPGVNLTVRPISAVTCPDNPCEDE